jgi:uncharacterized membrane protein YphA (DoxX/SURF4 family)
LVPVTFMMHNFWAVADPARAQIEKAMFMRNVALNNANLGAGPLSLDALIRPASRRATADKAA